MPNIGVVLRDEISRVARKSTKGDVDSLRKASAEHRRQIAALKRQVAALSKQVTALGRSSRKSAGVAPVREDQGDERLRFSAKGFAKKRQQLGLSAADLSKLLGVSALSVYKWESGKVKPRQGQLKAIASVRTLGKKAAAERLAQLDS